MDATPEKVFKHKKYSHHLYIFKLTLKISTDLNPMREFVVAKLSYFADFVLILSPQFRRRHSHGCDYQPHGVEPKTI